MVHNLFWQTVVFVEDNYSMDHRGGEWFQDGSRASIMHFISVIITSAHLQALDPGGWESLLYGKKKSGE